MASTLTFYIFIPYVKSKTKFSKKLLPTLNGTGQGYFTQPTISNKQIIFVCENDLWQVPLEGGRAQRLTSSRSETHSPVDGRKGKWIGGGKREEGEKEGEEREGRGGRRGGGGGGRVVAGWVGCSHGW